MSNIAIYNPLDPVVANRVTTYLLSVNTPDYDSVVNKLVNPDVTSVFAINQYYWKVNIDNIVEMTSNEKLLMDNFLKAKTFRSLKYRIYSYNAEKKLDKITWYDTNSGDGTYTGIAQQILYIYQSFSLIKKIENTYYYDGTIASTITTEFFNNDQNELIEKNS